MYTCRCMYTLQFRVGPCVSMLIGNYVSLQVYSHCSLIVYMFFYVSACFSMHGFIYRVTNYLCILIFTVPPLMLLLLLLTSIPFASQAKLTRLENFLPTPVTHRNATELPSRDDVVYFLQLRFALHSPMAVDSDDRVSFEAFLWL